MPQLASDGKWVSGIAGVGVYHQDKTIWGPGLGGGAQSLFNDEVIGQRTIPDTPVGLYSHNLNSGGDWLLWEGPIYYVGASRNGHWVIRTNEGTLSVVRDSFGRKFTGAGVGGNAMGPDGSIIMKRLYHSSGPYDVVEPDGSTWLLTPGDAFIFANYGDKRVTWLDDSGWHGVGVPDPLPLSETAFSFSYVFWGDELWQLYQMGDGRLVLHPRGDPLGYELAPAADAFAPDWLVLPDGRLRVVWAVREGEDPGSIRVIDIDQTDPRKDLTAVVMPPVDMVASQDRLFLIAPFIFNDYDEGEGPAISNNRLPIRSRQMWAEVLGTPDDVRTRRVIFPYAIWAGEDPGSGLTAEQAIDAARPLADKEGVGLLVYQDSRVVRKSVLNKTKPHDIIVPQFYKDPNETWDDFLNMMIEESERLSEYRLMPVISVYDRVGTLSDRDMAQVVIFASHIAFSYKWFGVMLFRFGTKDGLTDTTHQAIRPYLERLYEGVDGAPPQPKPEEVFVPFKTSVSHLITNFAFGEFDRGINTRPAYAVGAHETVEVIKNSDGTYSLKNDTGTEWLSVQPDGSISSRPTSDPSMPREWEKFNRVNNTLVEATDHGGRPRVTFLVAGSL